MYRETEVYGFAIYLFRAIVHNFTERGITMKRNYVLMLITVIISLIFIPYSVSANEGDVDFSIQALIPENQIDKKKTYFDLKMKPEQKQDIQLQVFNSSSKKITIEMDVTFATTNQNGLIDYTISDISKADESLRIPLPEITNISNREVVLQPGQSKIVTITITMPEEEYDGVILGAVHFKKKLSDKNESDSSGSVRIRNEYAYVVGVKLTETEKLVKPELELKYIQPKLVNYRTTVVANLQNSKAAIVENLNVDAEIFKEDSGQVLHSAKKEGMTMAPNSNFDFPINWENEPLKPGTYRLKMKAVAGYEKWEWDQTFTIGEDAEVLNNMAVQTNMGSIRWYFYGGILFF